MVGVTKTKARKPSKKPVRRKNVYHVVSIRGMDVFFDGKYTNLKAALEKARHIDGYLTYFERKNGSSTEVWKNYNEDTGDVEKFYIIKARRF